MNLDLFFALLVIHVLAAAIWIGGTWALNISFNPSLKMISSIQAGFVSKRVENHIVITSFVALGTISVTGLAIASMSGLLSLIFLTTASGIMLMTIIGLTGLAIANGVILTFYFTPKLKQIKFGESPTRRLLVFLTRLNGMVGVILVVLMVVFS